MTPPTRGADMKSSNELLYFVALKRIAGYINPEVLHRSGEQIYGVSGQEAIEMAYENVLSEARSVIKGKRPPKVKKGRSMKYFLRIRFRDSDPWGEPKEYKTRRGRDKDAEINRIIGGIRTHSYDEPTPRRRKPTVESTQAVSTATQTEANKNDD